jgi:hypothetical protein
VFPSRLIFLSKGAPTMHDICEETMALVCVCDAIHDRLACQQLTKDDREVIELSCISLLTKLRPEFRAANA